MLRPVSIFDQSGALADAKTAESLRGYLSGFVGFAAERAGGGAQKETGRAGP